MAIERFYTEVSYEKAITIDNWGGTTSSGFENAVTIQGFIQYRNGSENTMYSSNGELVNAVLYTSIDNEFTYGSKINGKYKVISSEQDNGVSGVGHHKEILLSSKV